MAALIATVTFAAGFTLPGGYNVNEGTATLAKKSAFKAFVVMDTLAMVLSVSAIFIFFFYVMACEEGVSEQTHNPWLLPHHVGNGGNGDGLHDRFIRCAT